MKNALIFGLLSAALIFGGAFGVTLLKPDPTVARAVWTSAVLAFVVQLFAFGLAKAFAKDNPIVGWGLGSLVRFAALLFYAFVGTQALGLASGTALISFAAFLFVSMLVEPLFLKP